MIGKRVSAFTISARSRDATSRERHTLPITYGSIGWYVAAAEGILIAVIAAASSFFYNAVHLNAASNAHVFSAVGAMFAICYMMGMQARGLYRPSAILRSSGLVRNVIITWAGVFCIMLAFGFLAKVSSDFSRSVTIGFFISGVIGLPLYRFALRRLIVAAIANNVLAGRRQVVLFGELRQLADRGVYEDLRRHGCKIAGQITLAIDENNMLGVMREISNACERLQAFVQENKVDEIFLVLGAGNQRLIDLVTERMGELPFPVSMLLDHKLGRMLNMPLIDLGAAKAIKLQSGPLSGYQQKLKRAFDILASSAGLVTLAPLLIAVAIAIRLDSPGPVIFRQRRAGFSGRQFYIYKFRSMSSLDDGAVVVQAQRNDKRVTRVGRFIRKTSIDELPQLLNVLRGEMSIVGPRPHALSHDSQYNKLISTYALRHHVKPGITGWAQVNGCRGETSDVASMAARIEYDLWYIVHWSMFLDMKAVFLTVVQAFRPKNVY